MIYSVLQSALTEIVSLVDAIKLFGTYSGLKTKHKNTEILLLGNVKGSSSKLGVIKISKVIKILGVNFTFDHSLCMFYKLNFESIDKSLRGLLKGWNWRGLTLHVPGKIQVIKSFAIPKILYMVVLISDKKRRYFITLYHSFV